MMGDAQFVPIKFVLSNGSFLFRVCSSEPNADSTFYFKILSSLKVYFNVQPHYSFNTRSCFLTCLKFIVV